MASQHGIKNAFVWDHPIASDINRKQNHLEHLHRIAVIDIKNSPIMEMLLISLGDWDLIKKREERTQVDAATCSTQMLKSGYLIRSSSKDSAFNLTGSLFPSNEAAFLTINRNVHTCA